MNKKRFAAVSLIVVLFLGAAFVVARTAVFKPADGVKGAKIPPGEYDPAVWGRHYPLEYKSYQRNLAMEPSPAGYGGSMKIQHSIRQPEILTNFKGMAFGKDYAEDRGHPYALTDLKETQRITPKSPGACMTCKTVHLIDIYKEMGWSYAKTPLGDLFPRMKHSIVCGNCHDPATMDLRVANPAFIEAMQRRGVDIKRATREEMRSYVCGQCHVEYYFEPETSIVIFPWDKGLHPEQMYAYYGDIPKGFAGDWLHPDSQVQMLKAQHPDFETWIGGTHGKAGISCVDCHMPYVRESGKKYTSHWVTSPMKHIETSCRPCHSQTPEWLMDNVKTTQNNTWQLQHTAGKTVAKAHEVIGKVRLLPNISRSDLDKARELLRKAQWYWDFVAAESSMGFHNPSQVMNVLGQSIDLAHQAIAAANRAGGRTIDRFMADSMQQIE
ncbi:MAG TPA: ammonia-forming cytochrome c nitrite reductase subunit c552 [Syntrophorhabdaceae bacterium]|nr:ammonia-forming cytochrome c nitrite reductase subunit c552 [Syntrophorhabdaceae bacterium]HQM81820.1 ammonia-forming cytochrome c nitrite reductase subunit c552 [Syntrophorhabdaceae bacterium]